MPAALENQITADNAPRIQARLIGEGANGPTTAEADAILAERGIIVVPDIFLNAGGVIVSYFEWLKNLSHIRFGRMTRRFERNAFAGVAAAIEHATGTDLTNAHRDAIGFGADEAALVESGLEESICEAYRQIRNIQQNKAIPDLRSAAFCSAIDKIAKVYIERGTLL